MPVLIELKVNGVTVGGVDAWWDEVEAATRGRREEFPILSGVDPYGDVELHTSELIELSAELARLTDDPRSADIPLLGQLVVLCQRAVAEPNAKLTFTGD